MAKKLSVLGKGLQSKLAVLKKTDSQAALEYEMAFQTNSNRGKVWNQTEIMALYSRKDWDAPQGASKITHLDCHNGKEFQYIVIKRHLVHGWTGKGNQLVQEIEAYKKMVGTPADDLICPILKWFTSKSDKVSATSEKMQNNVVIIAQKAVYVSDANSCCRKAEELNRLHGYNGESRTDRYIKLENLSDEMGWWDAMHNNGNSGVIFDYAKQCYKAVFIDYAL
jgi:hypothetical protein